jgi:hypothetical protein
MTTVFCLRHMEDDAKKDGSQSYKAVGVYSTRDRAREALGRYLHLKGFKDYPERWRIQECVLDAGEGWAEGFDIKTHRPI